MLMGMERHSPYTLGLAEFAHGLRRVGLRTDKDQINTAAVEYLINITVLIIYNDLFPPLLRARVSRYGFFFTGFRFFWGGI
jgi:hypothetical protein